MSNKQKEYITPSNEYPIYIDRLNNRPKAWWGAVIKAGMDIASSIISAKKQKDTQRATNRLSYSQNTINAMAAKRNSDAQYAAQLTNNFNQSIDDQQILNNRYSAVARNGKKVNTDSVYITDGGYAQPVNQDGLYLLRGRSHEQIGSDGKTGIGIKVGKNEIEAENNEGAFKKGNSLYILSAQPYLGINGYSPTELAVNGITSKENAYKIQEQNKKNMKKYSLKGNKNKAREGEKIEDESKYWSGVRVPKEFKDDIEEYDPSSGLTEDQWEKYLYSLNYLNGRGRDENLLYSPTKYITDPNNWIIAHNSRTPILDNYLKAEDELIKLGYNPEQRAAWLATMSAESRMDPSATSGNVKGEGNYGGLLMMDRGISNEEGYVKRIDDSLLKDDKLIEQLDYLDSKVRNGSGKVHWNRSDKKQKDLYGEIKYKSYKDIRDEFNRGELSAKELAELLNYGFVRPNETQAVINRARLAKNLRDAMTTINEIERFGGRRSLRCGGRTPVKRRKYYDGGAAWGSAIQTAGSIADAIISSNAYKKLSMPMFGNNITTVLGTTPRMNTTVDIQAQLASQKSAYNNLKKDIRRNVSSSAAAMERLNAITNKELQDQNVLYEHKYNTESELRNNYANLLSNQSSQNASLVLQANNANATRNQEQLNRISDLQQRKILGQAQSWMNGIQGVSNAAIGYYQNRQQEKENEINREIALAGAQPETAALLQKRIDTINENSEIKRKNRMRKYLYNPVRTMFGIKKLDTIDLKPMPTYKKNNYTITGNSLTGYVNLGNGKLVPSQIDTDLSFNYPIGTYSNNFYGRRMQGN